MDRKEISTILASAGLSPQHRFGQNFMVDQNVLQAIADAGDITPGDIVLEVGPGVGNLTRLLSQKAGPTGVVITVDIDKRLMAAAQKHHAALTNVLWIQGDVLAGKHELNPDVIAQIQTQRAQRQQRSIRLVSNLPYNAASPLVAELIVWAIQNLDPNPTIPIPVTQLAFTVQWEVAQRLAAKPQTADYGPLGVLIQLSSQVEVVRKIPPGAFWPPPKINSGLVKIQLDRTKMTRISNVLVLQRLLTGVFGHRRQTLLNGLKHYLGENYPTTLPATLNAAAIDPTLRPEALLPEQFLSLAKIVEPFVLNSTGDS